MRKITAITLKELKVHFQSPMAYITLFVTLCVFNVFFYLIIDQNREATLKDVFQAMEFMLIFIVPLLTMKVFSEEKQLGTMEFLMTTPTSPFQVITGKYLGSLTFFTLLIGLTGIYYLLLESFGNPDRIAIFVGYFGVWLEGAFFVAIGLLTSSWTRNQVISALVSYVIIFLLYLGFSFIQYVEGTAEAVINIVSIIPHSQNFFAGLFTLADLVYFISGIIFCLLLTRISLDHQFRS